MNFFKIDSNFVQSIKDKYPPGTRIELDCMGDDPRPIGSGVRGTVRVVDDMATVHCNFDNGRRMGLIPSEDSFHVICDEALGVELFTGSSPCTCLPTRKEWRK